MNFKKLVMLGALCAASVAAVAQWQWIDKDGRKVFSDRAPPPETPEKNILRQPGSRVPGAQAAATAATGAASAPATAGAAPRPAGVDKELEEKKKQAEQADAARKKAEEEKFLKTKADNCTRAKQAKAGLDSGIRVVRTNEKGEREILDDAARAAETQRIQDVIQSQCN